MNNRYVYILHGTRYYVGSTNNINKRLEQHKRGHTYSTKRIGDWKLIKIMTCENKQEARSLEKKIKKSGHIDRYIID